MNTETKYRTIVVAAAAPFIIIGGICIGLGWKYVSRAWNREPKDFFPRSMSFAGINGGKPALKRLIDYRNYQNKAADVDVYIKELESTLLGNEKPRFEEIQSVLASLEMSRREDEAIKVLKKALKKAKKQKKSDEVYEIEMLLAEMYIYKGDFGRALKCKCLVQEDQGVSDSRRPLYKAIISMMEQNEQEAQEHWTNFKEIQHQTIPPSFNDEEFTEFKNAVDLLKQDIDAATQLKDQ